MRNRVQLPNEPLISLIIPVYKVEQYLDRCLQSVVEQSYENLEIILVDDGSPDGCPALCDAWAEKDKRIRVIHKANGGLSDARNAGLAVAAGEYLAFIDSDDWLSPEMLMRLYDALQRDDSDIAACAVEMFWEDDTPPRCLTARTNCVLDTEQAEAALLAESTLKQPVWYKLYRRACIEGIPFETGRQHEDVFWSYQVFGNARRVSVIDYVGYHYRQRENSIMGAVYSLKRLDAIEAYERRYTYLAERFPGLERKARIAIVSACVFHGQMAQRYLPPEDCRRAMSYLNSVKSRYPLHRREYADKKLTQRLWLELAGLSLPMACRIKNRLGVGL